MRYSYDKNHARRVFAAVLAVVFSALAALSLAFPALAADRSAGAGIGRGPFEVTPDNDGFAGGGAGNGGRLGENYNSPSANGGGSPNGEGAANGEGGEPSYGDAGREDAAYDDGQMYDDGYYSDTFEEGEVLGVTDSENSATVGIVIAILIAVAVIILIIALLPRGTTGA